MNSREVWAEYAVRTLGCNPNSLPAILDVPATQLRE